MEQTQTNNSPSNKKVAIYLFTELLDIVVFSLLLAAWSGLAMALGWYRVGIGVILPTDYNFNLFMGLWFVPSLTVVLVIKLWRLIMNGIPELGIKPLL